MRGRLDEDADARYRQARRRSLIFTPMRKKRLATPPPKRDAPRRDARQRSDTRVDRYRMLECTRLPLMAVIFLISRRAITPHAPLITRRLPSRWLFTRFRHRFECLETRTISLDER